SSRVPLQRPSIPPRCAVPRSQASSGSRSAALRAAELRLVYGTVMVSLGDVKRSAAALFAQGQYLAALRLYDAIVAAAPLDVDARIRVADCALALGDPGAARVYRAAGWYCLRSGHPLGALVCARVLEAHGADAADLTAALVVTYGSESDLLG